MVDEGKHRRVRASSKQPGALSSSGGRALARFFRSTGAIEGTLPDVEWAPGEKGAAPAGAPPMAERRRATAEAALQATQFKPDEENVVSKDEGNARLWNGASQCETDGDQLRTKSSTMKQETTGSA